MITKSQIKKNVDKAYAVEIRSGMNGDRLVDFIESQILAYCKPECLFCYDKAYTTNLHGIEVSTHSGGDVIVGKSPRVHMLYCHCRRGKELRKMIEDNYESKL